MFKRRCRCSIFAKPNIITGDSYDLVEEFKKYVDDDRYFGRSDYGYFEVFYYDGELHFDESYLCYEITSYSIPEKSFYKKACLKCNTCVGDYQKMIDEFKKMIDYINRQISYSDRTKKLRDSVNRICG